MKGTMVLGTVTDKTQYKYEGHYGLRNCDGQNMQKTNDLSSYGLHSQSDE